MSSTQKQPSQSLLEKIVKALNMAKEGSGAAWAEREKATRWASSKLLEYNLSVNDLRDIGRKGAVVDGGVELQSHSWSIPHQWQLDLIKVLCKYHFCMVLDWEDVYFKSARKWSWGKVRLVGRRENVEVVTYLYNFLYKQIHHLAYEDWTAYLRERHAWAEERYGLAKGSCPHPFDLPETWKARGETARPKRCPRWTNQDLGAGSILVWERSFGEGCVQGLDEKLQDERDSALGENADSRALVVLIDKEVADEWHRRKYGMSKDEYEAVEELKDAAYQKALQGEEFDIAAELTKRGVNPDAAPVLAGKERTGSERSFRDLLYQRFQSGERSRQQRLEWERRDNAPTFARPASATFSSRRTYTSKSCSRCGTTFSPYGKERLCYNCQHRNDRPGRSGPLELDSARSRGVRTGRHISLRAGVNEGDESGSRIGN